MASSQIVEQSYQLAKSVVILVQQIQNDRREFLMSKQLLRCGTSVGANISEAQSAESRSDFIHKLSVSLKEARETSFWLRLMFDTNYISDKHFNDLHGQTDAVIRMLTKSILTMKNK